MSDDDLTTLTLTVGERRKVARCLTMAMAMVDALGDDTRDLMELWARVADGVEAL